MPLPLNLAMTPSEIKQCPSLPAPPAWMSCHFSEDNQGLTDLPEELPEGCLLILDDRIPCNGHSAPLAAAILREVIAQFHCCALLLDFQRPANIETAAMVEALIRALPYPVAAPPEYAKNYPCPVFLPPAPLHIPLEKYLRPWHGREVWLEVALCQERITVSKNGATVEQIFAAAPYCGFFDETLCCRYVSNIQADRITFTLFETYETLESKLELADSLGVTRAVGLYQELGKYFIAKYKPPVE